MFWLTLSTPDRTWHKGPFPSLASAQRFGRQSVKNGDATSFEVTVQTARA